MTIMLLFLLDASANWGEFVWVLVSEIIALTPKGTSVNTSELKPESDRC